MDFSNISEGQIFKNYKELCSSLGEEPKTSNPKNAQIKEWERYFRYSKKGHKFIIEEIYDVPKNKQDLRFHGNNTSPYIDDIEKLILDLLAQDNNNGQLFLSRSKLLKELKMINENYTYFKSRKPTLSKFMNIHIEEIKDFYESSYNTFKSNLETALNRLQRQALIYWNYALTVCYVNTHIQTTSTGYVKATKTKYINNRGEEELVFNTVKPTQNVKYRKATENEIRIILEVEREMLKQYKCNDKSEVYKKGRIQDFYDDVNNIIFDKTNIVYYYNSYEILYNDKHIEEKLEELKLQEGMKFVTQNYLNKGVIEKITTNAEKRHNDAKELISENVLDDYYYPNDVVRLRSNDKYLTNNNALSDALINKNSERIY